MRHSNLTKPVGVIAKTSIDRSKGQTYFFEKNEDATTQQASVSDRQRLLSEGYVERDGKLYAPSVEFDSAYYYKSREHVVGSYSPEVVEVDASGSIVKITKYEPQTVYATSGYVLREVRESGVVDYERGVETTNPRAQIEGSLVIDPYGDRLKSKPSVASEQEARSVFVGGSTGGKFESDESTNRIGYASGGVSAIYEGKKSNDDVVYVQDVTRPYTPPQSARVENVPFYNLTGMRPGKSASFYDNTLVPVNMGVYLKLRGLNPSEMSYDTSKAAIIGYNVSKYKAEELKLNDIQREPWKTSLVRNPIQYGGQIVGGALGIIESGAIGVGKIVYGELSTERQMFPGIGPKVKGLYAFPIPDVSIKSNERRFNMIRNDRDVQIAYFAVGGTILASINPVAALGVELTALGFGTYETYYGLKTSQPGRVGEGLITLVGGRPIQKASRIGTELFGERVAPQEIFGGVISGKKVTARGLSESLRMFEEGRLSSGKIEVVTASQTKLSGELVRIGEKGRVGVEDPVQYFAPKGRANPGFAGVGINEASSELSFGMTEFVSKRPTVSSFIIEGIVRYPRGAILERGFGTPRQLEFLNSLKDSGLMVVTKRSELGQGEIPRQFFKPFEDITLRTKSFSKENFYLEAGTSEAEIGASEGSLFRNLDVGFKERLRYTIVNQKKIFGFDITFTGELVRLPKYELIRDAVRSDGVFESEDFLNVKDVVREERRIVSDYEASRTKSSVQYNFGSIISKRITPKIDNSFLLFNSSGYSSILSSTSSLVGFSRYSSFGNSSDISGSSDTSQVRYTLSKYGSEFSLNKSIESSEFSVGSSLRYANILLSKSLISPNRSLDFGNNSKGNSRFSIEGDSVDVFDVLVRESNPKGKAKIQDVKVNKKPLPRNAALNLADEYVDNTSARSFRLVKRGRGKVMDDALFLDEYKYRPTKQTSKIPYTKFVELEPYLIDSPGEVQGISAKGWKARRKQMSGLGWNFA